MRLRVLVTVLADDMLGRYGAYPSFSPILDHKSIGNGVHIHFIDDADVSMTQFGSEPHGKSIITG